MSNQITKSMTIDHSLVVAINKVADAHKNENGKSLSFSATVAKLCREAIVENYQYAKEDE